MNPRIRIVAVCAAALAAACSDASQPTAPSALSPAGAATAAKGGRAFENYVAIGTSISMGWLSNGVYSGSQLVSWPSQLRFGSLPQMSLPLIQSPGCTSPYAAPLGNATRLSGEPLPQDSEVCAPNVAGVQLPTQNVALGGTLAIDALVTTPATAGADRPFFARVLPPGMTQVTAALSQNPTLVSVELGGNDILFTTSGLVVPGVTFTPFPLFAQAFGAVLDAVGSSEPKVLVVSLPADGRNLPALRRGDEIWADAAEFAALHVDVSPDCQGNQNYINVSLKSLILVFTAAFTSTHGLPNPVYSCADIPGTVDFVLTPADLATLNGFLGQMTDLAEQQAAARGYAFFSIGVLYDRPDLKPPVYSIISQLTSPNPFGPFISLDGVHPSALGHSVLALAAAHALNKTYSGIAAHADTTGVSSVAGLFVEPMTPTMTLAWAKQMAMEHQGQRMPTCLMPGGCFLPGARRPK